ncbi:MAG TPA: TlpA disulfide reductase family protein, partial [Bryobacteraceae bacterium]
HVNVSLNDPQLKAAFVKLDEIDRLRQGANFSLQDLHGKSWTLKDLPGKVVLVNFWATWCPPCRKEMPDLDALYRRFKKKGLVILSISSEEEATVRKFLADKNYTYPILLDPGEKANKEFVIEGIPKSFLYDREGKLVAQAIDMRTQKQFLEMLKTAGVE